MSKKEAILYIDDHSKPGLMADMARAYNYTIAKGINPEAVPDLAAVCEGAVEALRNVPEVGGEYDQQHSDTHTRAVLCLLAALANCAKKEG